MQHNISTTDIYTVDTTPQYTSTKYTEGSARLVAAAPPGLGWVLLLRVEHSAAVRVVRPAGVVQPHLQGLHHHHHHHRHHQRHHYHHHHHHTV